MSQTPDPTDAKADGNFGSAGSHRTGYANDKLANAEYWARKGGTLNAGEGAILCEEIDRLREQLRDTHTQAFHLGEKLSVMEQERDQFASMLHDCENERDGWKHRAEADALRHRAERMARVFAAAEDFISYQGTANEPSYYDALVAEVTMERLALSVNGKGRAIERTKWKITEAMIRAAFVRLYPGCDPDEMQHYHAADIRAALKAALDAEAQP